MARIRKREERITLQLLEGSAGREGKRSNSQDSKLTRENRQSCSGEAPTGSRPRFSEVV